MSRPMAPREYTLTMTRPAGSSTNPVACRKRGLGLTNAPVAAAMVVEVEVGVAFGDAPGLRPGHPVRSLAVQPGRDALVGCAPRRERPGCRGACRRARVQVAVDHPGDGLDGGDAVGHARVVLGQHD